MAKSKPNKTRLSETEDELRKPAKLKPSKGKPVKRAKDVSAFEEDYDSTPAEGGNAELLSDDDVLFNDFDNESFDDDDDDF